MRLRPVFVNKDGHRVEVDTRVHGRVRFCAQGGGFVNSMPARLFDRVFSKAPAATFSPGFVIGDWMDGGVALPCFLDGDKWNGWACPYFELREAIVAAGESGAYDPVRDAFVITVDRAPPEVYPGELIEVAGRKLKVYPIGASGWCWDEVAGRSAP